MNFESKNEGTQMLSEVMKAEASTVFDGIIRANGEKINYYEVVEKALKTLKNAGWTTDQLQTAREFFRRHEQSA
jgi:hypothetical protein